MNNKAISTLQIALGARKIVFGEQLLKKIQSKQAFVVVLASDAGQATSKKIIDKCRYYQIPVFVTFLKEDLKQMIFKDISALGIVDKNLAKKWIDNIKEGSVFYEEKN